MSLEGFDLGQVGDVDWGSPFQAPVRSKEVVIGDKESGDADGAVSIFEAASGASMELIGSVKPFDNLLELTILLAFFILITKADHFTAFEWHSFFITVDGMGCCAVGWIAITDKLNGMPLGVRSCFHGLLERDKGMQDTTIIRDMPTPNCF